MVPPPLSPRRSSKWHPHLGKEESGSPGQRASSSHSLNTHARSVGQKLESLKDAVRALTGQLVALKTITRQLTTTLTGSMCKWPSKRSSALGTRQGSL